jgi:hypothetical protein
MPAVPFALDPATQRKLAARLFNRVWEILDQDDRDEDTNEEMLHCAHASRYHWGQVGEPVNWARGEWQCSRVYSMLGRAEPALHHARRCLQLAQEYDLGPFDIGTAHEAVARAARVADLADHAALHAQLALAAAEKLTDPEERQVLLSDIASL